MSSIPGLKILKQGIKLRCNKKSPCIIRNPDSEDPPRCRCCIKEIDSDKWIHNVHQCTTNLCTKETYLGLDDTKNGLSRRTQHYGYLYNYKSSKLIETRPLNSNKAIHYLADLVSPNFKDEIAQCIVNEYTTGQGISPHIDSLIFGSIIITITLIGDSIMLMTKSEENVGITLNPGDIVLLTGEARKCWKHSIKNLTDPRRIFVTFRTLAK